MIADHKIIRDQILGILNDCNFSLSTEMPSVWAQSKMSMSEGNFQGPLSHDITPYWTEILDNLSPYSGYEEVVLMGGSQGGKTKAVIEPVICYYISEHPCNIGYISGNTDLALESMIDLDKAIENSGIKHLIRPSTERIRNSRSGDTNKMKEYQGGNLIGGSATNHKTFRRRNWRLIIGDDIEEANDGSAKAGSTVEIIKKRANSYGKNKKIFWCSTPLLLRGSIIYPLYLNGDQRKYHIPCQCCGELIHLEFKIQIDGKETAGIDWDYDSNNKLKPGSVRYICQKCGNTFTEKNKYRFNKDGLWMPTATAESEAIVSYYWNNLYCAPGMDNWDTIVREWIEANPVGQPRNERKMQTFMNLRMGLPYEGQVADTDAKSIMRNMRDYDPGIVPEQLSIADGNGEIMMLSCTIDLNGLIDDARIDYDIRAWSEAGACYMVTHGSIGTFVRGEGGANKHSTERERWTYESGKHNSAWVELDKMLDTIYPVDTGRKMKVYITLLDTGHFTTMAYEYMDRSNHYIIGIKGGDEDRFQITHKDRKIFKQGKNRTDLYVLDVNLIKDTLWENMQLNWNRGAEMQPYGFMNFPRPTETLFTYEAYFVHFEGERRDYVTNSHGEEESKWVKKQSNSKNHFWDCAVYQLACREIFLHLAEKLLNQKGRKVKDLTWAEYCEIVK